MDTSETLVGHGIRVRDERAKQRGELALGRYRLLDRLGSGGFGTVWRAHDEQLVRAVALKRIPLPSGQERERAMREAHASARLAHPAIVALYEACADEDAFYLVSELVEGETLAQLIAADELDDEFIAEIGVALACALEHAHARGVVHRDVKPQNVLVPSRDGGDPAHAATTVAAKLADFGGALLAGGDALTRTGDVYGTLAYMAPEQSEGAQVGPAADLYSLALILYEALTGVNPVRGRTPAATAKRIGAPIESLARRRRDLPRELTRALDRALVADPSRRGTLTDLRQVLVDAPLHPPFPRGGRTRRSPPSPTVLQAQPGAPWPASERELGGDEEAREREGGALEAPESPTPEDRSSSRRGLLVLPRLVWIASVLSVAIWQAARGLSGVAVLVLAAGAPLLLLSRRAGPGWLAAAAAPALGVLGLAGAYPALAGQRKSASARAGLAALGFWWLALAEPLLSRRLWLGPPAVAGERSGWERSADGFLAHVLGGVITPELAIGASVWAFAAVALPWVVRGSSAATDVLGALVWSLLLLAGAPLAERTLLHQAATGSPRGALVGTMLGCALAICSRALRGPT